MKQKKMFMEPRLVEFGNWAQLTQDSGREGRVSRRKKQSLEANNEDALARPEF